MFKTCSFKLHFLNNFEFLVFTLNSFFIYYSYSSIYKFTLSFNNEYSKFKHRIRKLPIYVSRQFPLIFRKTMTFTSARSLFRNDWKKTLKQFFILSFIKMRYKGKGYKIYYKKNKKIYLRFGFSHKNFHTRFSNHSRFFYKWVLLSRIIFLGYSWRSLRESILKLVKKRYANIFTIRGMILQKTTIVKKPGKISTYF